MRRAPSRTSWSINDDEQSDIPAGSASEPPGTIVSTGRTFPTGVGAPILLEGLQVIGRVRPLHLIHRSQALLVTTWVMRLLAATRSRTLRRNSGGYLLGTMLVILSAMEERDHPASQLRQTRDTSESPDTSGLHADSPLQRRRLDGKDVADLVLR